ncbi:hypothetical protein NUW58_g8517 [Xylaria curta]|uniref:Uncharacterized protein n=1 Tax=Xylaria curta TaxID=42375 RepID=A0ACC1N6K8_9PEZI|nr:hypothetical protein NUW58_g8517 [Xylaria curta]
MSPAKWVDNGRAFELVFNESVADGGGSGSAFIEDYYHLDGFESVAGNIGAKFEAVEDHLRKAAKQDFDSLFITFTSATHVEVDPPVYPDVMALGTPAGNPPVRGVNERLRELLKEMKGRRLGVVVMDFFEEPDGLVDLLLDF